jgi:hypothetical protein
MNNEPVAYLHKDGSLIRVDPRIEVIDPDLIPLYTHPVKTLTDEEIQQIWLEFDARNTNDWFIAIARAILRKAQEK